MGIGPWPFALGFHSLLYLFNHSLDVYHATMLEIDVMWSFFWRYLFYFFKDLYAMWQPVKFLPIWELLLYIAAVYHSFITNS